MIYLDSSAILTLIFGETHSKKLDATLADEVLATSLIAHVEIHRAMRRNDTFMQDALGIIDRINFLEFDTPVARTAELVPGNHLASLDAIHIATAYLAGVKAFVTYDARQKSFAEEMGLRTLSPGMN
ncbi:MAG: hypothetical protein RL410_818 [Actinomycetota bacterium]|jgi:predicted nucleic acid-binding protein